MTDDEFRVEVALSEEEHGVSLGERLRTMDLDDEAQERLGSNAIVTRDGMHLFVYAGSIETAREAKRVVTELAEEDGLTADVSMTRWHPVEGSWKDAEAPLPDSEAERVAELKAKAERVAGEDPGVQYPTFVMIQSYKPEFMRDLGL
ncbi:hypothetical protein BH10ACT11_BH10ACT11_19920 [soil metagenome]